MVHKDMLNRRQYSNYVASRSPGWYDSSLNVPERVGGNEENKLEKKLGWDWYSCWIN